MPTVNKQSGKKKIDGYTKNSMALVAVSNERQKDTFIWCFTISLPHVNLFSATNVGKYLYRKIDL